MENVTAAEVVGGTGAVGRRPHIRGESASDSCAIIADVNDDEMRTFLGSLPRAGMGCPLGHVCILRYRVTDAGGDPDAADAWVIENGGRIDRTPPVISRGLAAGRPSQMSRPSEAIYVIPAATLEG